MKKLLNLLAGGLLIIILLIAAGLAYVMFAIDPNDYKPQIQEAAAEQDIDLDISGELAWQIVPRLAIRIGETSMSSATQAVPDTHFKSANLSLAWLPLLSKQVHINAISIDGADIRISSTEQATTTAVAPVAASQKSNGDATFGIAIDSIKITDSRITLIGERPAQTLVLDKLFFDGKKINVIGDAFPMALSFIYSDNSLPEALGIKLNAEISLNQKAQRAQLLSLTIAFDDTTITGKASVQLAAPRSLAASLSGDVLDLNRYLPANETTEKAGAGKKTTNSSALAQQTPAPIFAPLAALLTFLEGGTSVVEINWATLIADGLTVNAIHFSANSKGSLVDISDFSARALDGNIVGTARLGNLTGRTPTLSYTSEITNISLSEASQAFAEGTETDGTLNASMNGKSRGATGDQLFDNLSAKGTLQIIDPELKTINIEQSYCKVASMVEKIPLKEDWPAGSKLNDVEGDFRMQGRKLLLDGLNSGIGNLSLKTSGEIDLGAGIFNILAVTRLNGDRTSETGCVVESTKLHDRDIPLRCKGAFETAGADSCRPDGDIVKQLAKDKILETIGEKAGLSEEAGEAVDSLLKGLFGR